MLAWAGVLAVVVTVLIPRATPALQGPETEADWSRWIDQQISTRWQAEGITPAAACDDSAFQRRVYLDLAGRIPTTDEHLAFVKDADPRKRTRLVDSLLSAPSYGERMRDVFDVVFMGRGPGERRGGRRRGEVAGGDYRGQWLEYLRDSFQQNRPWDRLVSDLLQARPQSKADSGSVWFLYARQEKYQDIAEAISPAVFGLQVQCAQCHDHPLADEIKQAHYWGLVAFFNRGKNKATPAGPRVAESAIGGFSSFALLAGGSKPAELTFLGGEPIAEKRPAENEKEMDAPELYDTGSASEEPPVPKFSRRQQFVEKFVQRNPLVAKAAVNRFWALLMGRGIVHPVDKMDSVHPPSHPELLSGLAERFTASGYDTRKLVRSIVLSRSYGLAAKPIDKVQPDRFAYGIEKPLTAEALAGSLSVAVTGKVSPPDTELKASLVNVFPDVFVEESLSSLRQSMFLTNSPVFNKLFQPSPGSVVDRLVGIEDPRMRVKQAFQTALHRDPEPDELDAAAQFLVVRKSRPREATAQFYWALVSGPEFRFNH